jgi:2-aminoadipate transaminase
MTRTPYRLARRTSRLKASEIRELLKLTTRPEIISFAGGLPAAELFPAAEMAEITRRVLETEGCKALQYSATEGDPTLRHHIAERMNHSQQTRVQAGGILITSGSQQGLDLTGKILLDPDDVVLCESPTYLGALNAFAAYEPTFVEVDTDADGMVPAALEQALATHDRAKFIYAIPDFQNPTGRTWTLERRQALVDLAARHNIPVIEDCPYAELRFEGEPLPALHAVDTHDNVVYLGTFSKTFCPGLRCAWLAAPRALFDQYVMAKQGADLHTSTLIQRQVAGYLDLYGLDDNIRKVIKVYRQRRDLMLGVFDAEMPVGVHYTRPAGGLFLWLEFPGHVDSRQLLQRCLEKHVAFVPGGAFFPSSGHDNTARINFSCMPPERIEEGARRLCQVVTEYLG